MYVIYIYVFLIYDDEISHILFLMAVGKLEREGDVLEE